MYGGGATTRTRVEVLDGDRVSRREGAVATEEPMEIRLGWPGRRPGPLAVTMRTPGADFELAAGFCHAEGLTGIGIGADRGIDTGIGAGIDSVAYCDDGR